ncbi:MAG: FAD-binding oxidoreductase [Pseudomonadales bacterium]|nr:FAD-binding oxidoreductase [Pseudomonadales bacterium]
MANTYSSWGRYPNRIQNGCSLKRREDDLSSLSALSKNTPFLPYGLGRSYGDSCQNHAGYVVSSAQLNSFISFDSEVGILRCEAGVSLSDIIQVVLPQGWFLQVTPGTKYVTVAGAIANDVHGKNHHTVGSFGNHVIQFELLRSDGTRLICSESQNPDWFYATIGGLGLTGFITWVEIQLRPVKSANLDTENIKYNSLAEFFSISEESVESHEYTVAWLDCSATGASLGRGHFTRANHCQKQYGPIPPVNTEKGKLSFPITPPLSLINNLSVKAFNELYFNRQREINKTAVTNFDAFFYPLDGILHWNRMYGPKGFLQHQCIIPKCNAESAIKELLEVISASGMGSFLVVLKMMGSVPSKGLISFPSEGATLALDFPFHGAKTLGLLLKLDAIVSAAGGSLYPAKDARMSAQLFQQAYPDWIKLEEKRDPNINSDFWRRVTGCQ